jgi:hypothetical protein
MGRCQGNYLISPQCEACHSEGSASQGIIVKTVAHPDLSKYRLPIMLVVRLIFVNLFPPTSLKGVGLHPTTHYSMVLTK